MIAAGHPQTNLAGWMRQSTAGSLYVIFLGFIYFAEAHVSFAILDCYLSTTRYLLLYMPAFGLLCLVSADKIYPLVAEYLPSRQRSLDRLAQIEMDPSRAGEFRPVTLGPLVTGICLVPLGAMAASFLIVKKLGGILAKGA